MCQEHIHDCIDLPLELEAGQGVEEVHGQGGVGRSILRQINSVCEHLNEGIDKRLLIPGVVTHTILLQYINMLKVLQIIDSTGHIY